MKKWLIALAVILLISLLVCMALFGIGLIDFFNPHISADQVAAIHVTEGMSTHEIFEVTDPETIREITELVNNLGPTVGIYGTWNGWRYSVLLQDASGAEILRVTAVSENQISSEDYFYPADAADLIAYLSELDAQIS